MLNKANKALSADQHRFVELAGRMMAMWSLPPATGRLYGYLLLAAEPVSLDEIAAALDMSKSAASVAGRQLESWGMAHRIGERGSRRVRYEATASFEEMLRIRNRGAIAFADMFRQGATIATSERARERMTELADLFTAIVDEAEEFVRRWRER